MPGVIGKMLLLATAMLLGCAPLLCVALGSQHVKSMRPGSKFTPSHGEITSFPGFDGPLPS
ncbi:hypothetical protein MNEG_5621, partial [Monoraphidium neglectum]